MLRNWIRRVLGGNLVNYNNNKLKNLKHTVTQSLGVTYTDRLKNLKNRILRRSPESWTLSSVLPTVAVGTTCLWVFIALIDSVTSGPREICRTEIPYTRFNNNYLTRNDTDAVATGSAIFFNFTKSNINLTSPPSVIVNNNKKIILLLSA